MDCMSQTSISQFIIYVLHHPQSDHVYVGKSTKGLTRPRAHSLPSSLSRYAHLPRSKWIQSLRKRGLEPEVAVVEECATPEELSEAEQFHIAYLRSLGIPTLNCTDGGDGVLGHKPSDEARAKMSAKNKERTATEEGREKMATMAREYWADDAAREKKRAERLGQTWNEETRGKISAAHKGKRKTAEERANMSAAAKLRWATPGYREKQIEVQKASHDSDEIRARSAETAKLASHDTHRTPEYRAKQSEIVKRALERRKRGAPS